MRETAATSVVTPATRVDAIALVAGLVTVTLWGSAFVGIRAAGVAFSPGSLALGRLIVSSLLLGGVALFRREPLPRRRDLGPIAAYGVLWLAIYSISLNAAERIVDAGTAAMLIGTGPLLIAVLAGLFLREGFPRGLFGGLAIAFAGSVMIGVATAQSGSRAWLGILLLGAAVLAYSVAVVVQKSVSSRVSSFQVTWLGVTAATVASLPFSPGLAADATHANLAAIGWLVYLGAFPTALGFATWAFALRRTSAGRMASLTYLAPVVAVVLGWALLGEKPPWLALAGGGLCLAGVYVARRR
ncbi:MAG TPA: DMT family transporter [Candidatus Dormibacteraeota bacterium]|nr:DMT family transporter [Candidatus Dormibacteraeota bacterium]